ncbi:MauE/DoxX family redox-associated membrane protein [Actinoplanes auranticolor]|uniref:MauE/DoxX family redox-associated membrane protein n=1 Tax=Actinoplanes auranticolor TaxID=47988 RepID=UPI001BB3E229|nr:MauE/DoxX family redox-associated membrane protein [Actinoplanes auranticolor]
MAVDAAVRMVAAAVLLYSASQKLVAPSAIRQTIRALRLPAPHALATTVAIGELATAVLLLAAPRLWLTSTLIVGLGVSFASAALIARIHGESVRCACLGRKSETDLGWRQFALLPVWSAVAWVTHSGTSDRFSGSLWVAVTAVALAVIVVVFQLLPLGLRSWSYLKVLESQWTSSGSSSRSSASSS